MDNFDLKKYLVENKVTTNSRMLEVEMGMVPADVTGKDSYDGALPAGVKDDIKKFFDDFFNSPQAVNFAKKIAAKMSPEEKESFLSAKLNEDMHDTLRGLGGYKPGEEPTLVDNIVGRILKLFGQLGFMSGGLITPLVIAALDAFGGTGIGQQLGFGGILLSVLATFIGGGLVTLLGKILQNDRDPDMLS